MEAPSHEEPPLSPPPSHASTTKTPARRRAPSVSTSQLHQLPQLPPFDLDSLTEASRHGPSPEEVHLPSPQTHPVSSFDAPTLRRKPLPQTPSSAAGRFSPIPEIDDTSSDDQNHPVSIDDQTKAASIDNRSLHGRNDSTTNVNPIIIATDTTTIPALVLEHLDSHPRDHDPLISPDSTQVPVVSGNFPPPNEQQYHHHQHTPPTPPVSAGSDAETPTKESHVHLATDAALSNTSTASFSNEPSNAPPDSPTMSLYPSSKPTHLKLHLDADARRISNHSEESFDSSSTSKPKSPGKFGSFFGWKTASPTTSSSTTLSDKAQSPLPSPLSPKAPSGETSPSYGPALTPNDTSKSNADGQDYFGSRRSSAAPSIASTGAVRVDEMEDELRQISSELASSIRREMDLEDLVERLQSEVNTQPGGSRRTSDYFSDSGNSSVRALSDSESKHDEMEKSQRRMEQEKAQLRLDLTQKVQEERVKRKELEQNVHQLESQVQKVDFEQLKSSDATGRVKELEASLEDLRRKLSEERQIKDNFEDLLGALKGQIEEHRNERDNLRDEIVPQLRARVEGLESEAAEFQRLTYENTRMQQELASLKNENNTLVQARRTHNEMQLQGSRINSISEEGQLMKPGLTRANSTARSSMSGAKGGLTRLNSLKDRESRESLADRVKDIEAQRDALHRALRALLERQEHQNRENEKRIKTLEIERDRALGGSPKRMGYEREVTNLREEINHLRRRADEALEQKWQCEKGLSGLKMDLDRAEQETSSLRVLLSEHDILVPSAAQIQKNPEIQLNGVSTSESLERAYNELQSTHAKSLTRIRELETQGGGKYNPDADKKARELQESMAAAEAERDQARKEAEDYRKQAKSFQGATDAHRDVEKTLADQLRNSAARVEELASQVRLQLASNNTLKERLSEAISRGERDQKSSAGKISDMQRRLKNMEEQLVAAQQHTDDSVAMHEEEVRDLKESHNTQLQRMKNGLKAANANQSKNPLTPLFMNRGPKLDKTTSGESMSMTDITRTEELESRVKDLEKALSVADKEMEEVVGRMNKAQIEVMELQSERDEAARATRRLHGAIDQERVRVQALMA